MHACRIYKSLQITTTVDCKSQDYVIMNKTEFAVHVFFPNNFEFARAKSVKLLPYTWIGYVLILH